MTDLSRLSVQSIARDVQAGTISAASIMDGILSRLAIYDTIQPQVWISRAAPEDLRAQAQRVDQRIAAGEAMPLAGVPFAVKDNIDVAGFETTAGCPAFAYTPDKSAHVVEKLLEAGAICIGKTNLDQFATGLVGTRSPYGAPRNASNLDYVSGGSSSGSAVAVAAGLVAFSLGTDTAGSGRVPAAFNHLIGLKPSKGRWSTSGLVPACRTLDCITVFADSVQDARIIDETIAGFDPHDPFSRLLENAPLKAANIGVPRPDQREWFGDSAAQYFYEQALDRLSADAQIVELDIAPLNEAASLLYSGPWVAERSAAIERLLSEKPDAIDPTVRTVVEPGLGISAVEAFQGMYRLAELKRWSDQMWDEIDVLAFPTTGTTYRVRELEAAPIALNSNLGRYTNFVNLLDMAAVAIPAGVRDDRTGFGLTFIGPAHTDHALLDHAQAFLASNDVKPPPLDMGEHMETVKLAVVGAHLKDMPLHWQLTSREARFVGAYETAPTYRLFAMADSVPPKPALVHSDDGAAIKVEVYELDLAAFGSFVAEVPAPLAIGTVTLADGSSVKGFVAEPRATVGATDITHLGGWRAFIAQD
ncbi:MAG: allophanate hydrolase [Pseudomonadota bacterium]